MLSHANLKTHTQHHDKDPIIARYKATAEVVATLAGARSLGITNLEDVIPDGMSGVWNTDPLERYVGDDEDRTVARMMAQQ